MDRVHGGGYPPCEMRLAALQHSLFPLPPTLFGALFANRALAKLFRPYGHACWLADYRSRASNAEYWRSDRSIYWHLARSQDLDYRLLAELVDWPEARAELAAARVVVEPGFGLGKMTRALLRYGFLVPEKIIALEPVAAVRRRAKRLCRRWPVEIRDGGLEDVAHLVFDTMLLQGGVLMFYPPEAVRAALTALPTMCRRIVVIHEGAACEIARADGTWMHGLPGLIDGAGFSLVCARGGENGQPYSLFVARRHHELAKLQ